MWKIKQIAEADFGCEERMPGEKLKCLVILEDESGNVRCLETEDEWLTEQGLSGYCTCEKEAGKALLEEHKAEWQEQLVKEGIQPGAVYFTNTNSLNLKDFNKNQTKEQKSGSKADSVQLYRAAKAFIAFVRQTGDTERKSI